MTDESLMPFSLKTDRKILTGIYKITSPTNKIYIGQSVDIAIRYHKYRSLNCNCQIKLYASFSKYGFEKHIFEIIHLCSQEELNKLEKYYVDLYQSFNSKQGMNLKDGGGSRGKLSEESRLKIISKLKGKIGNRKGAKHKQESKIKMSISHLKINKVPWNKGIKNCFPIEVNIRRNKNLQNNSNATRTPICQYSMENVLIEIFSSISYASRITNVLRTSIINNIMNRTKSAGGYIWRKL